MEKLRIEAEQNLDRASKAEEQLKKLNADLSSKDTEIGGLKNKIQLLENEVARSEKRVEEVLHRYGNGPRDRHGRATPRRRDARFCAGFSEGCQIALRNLELCKVVLPRSVETGGTLAQIGTLAVCAVCPVMLDFWTLFGGSIHVSQLV